MKFKRMTFECGEILLKKLKEVALLEGKRSKSSLCREIINNYCDNKLQKIEVQNAGKE